MCSSNEFRTDNIFPIRIIAIGGNVSDSENILKEKTLQITTDENECTVLSNSASASNAFILLDFGKEYNGSLRILTHTVSGENDIRIRITYGESVSETLSAIGFKGATNDHAIRDFAALLTPYSDMTYIESGFRFAKIELLSPNTEIKVKAVTLVSKIRNIEYKGYFKCSNETLNKIFDTAAYTCHLCMQQFIWDGIKRDRLVWVGDMHPEMLTVRTIFGNHDIFPRSLRFMRLQTPLPGWMNGMPTYSLWWLYILYDWYLYSGDEAFLAENKDYALELIEIIVGLVNTDGSDNLPGYFLDWPCNDKPQSISGSRALLALTLDASEKLSAILNKTDLSLACRTKKEQLINTKIETYGAKQVTAIAALAGWMPAVEAGAEILNKGPSGWSTFMSYYLLKAASCYSMTETLDALCKYYGGMLSVGATTFWEDFDIRWLENATPIDCIPDKNKGDIHADFGAFCYKGLRHSLCHGWSSGPVAFLIENVLGINITSPGCKTITLAPDPGHLEFCEGCFPTPHGNIYVSCKVTENRISVKYKAPANIKISTKEKHKGEYTYEFHRDS